MLSCLPKRQLSLTVRRQSAQVGDAAWLASFWPDNAARRRRRLLRIIDEKFSRSASE
jgi:hypothetical protein